MSLPRPVGTLEEDDCVGAEFVNDLTARAAWRTGYSLVIDHGDCADLNLWTELRDGRKNRRTLGTVGHAVGSVFHIATGENLSVREENGGPDPEMRIRRMRVLHDSLG